MFEQLQQANEYMSNLLLMAAFFGAVLTIALYFLWLRDKRLSAIVSSVIGVLVVLFFFNSPESIHVVGDIFNNLTLLLGKVIWIFSWIFASIIAACFLP
jgi:hypothetical protein